MKYKIIVLIIILYLLMTNNLWISNGIKFMNFVELVEFNRKLILINNAGITYMYKNGSNMLDLFTNDKLLIKMHRRLHKKYGNIVRTHIITKSNNTYILDPDLAKKILNNSPHVFGSGNLKTIFFNKFMPYNLGVSECKNKKKCPWKKRREFNEKVLGTKNITSFFLCIKKNIEKKIRNPLLNIHDFKEISFKIVSEIIYGNSDNIELLKEFVIRTENNENLLKTDFYKKYKNHLHENYKIAPKCSLLYFANIYKNDKIAVIDDQIPHWFGPFIFIISFLIPNLLCIVINYKDVLNKIMDEINNEYFDIFSKKTFLHYCVIEHIRLFNTININIQKMVNKDIIFENIKFKKGEQIFILFSSILRNEREFKYPDKFIPKRWENKTIESQNIVFGIGPQICPSMQITPFIYKVIIRHLLLSFNYSNVTPKIYNKDLYFINPYNISFSI